MFEKFRELSNKKIVRETAIYGVTNMFYSGLPLLLMPFLITVMKPQDYGIIDFFKTFTLVLTPILGLSTVNSISRFFYDLDTDDFKTFVSSVLIFHVFSTTVGIVMLSVLGRFLPEKYQLICLLSIVFFLFNQITEALLQIFRVKQEAKNYFQVRIGGILLDLILLTFFYFVFSEYDWTYRVFPNVISTILIGLICIFVFYKKGYKIRFNKTQLLVAISYSAPLILHMLSGYILNFGDRFFILHYLDERELGNYAVAYQIGMAINFFYSSFNLAWVPTYYKWMKEERYSNVAKVKKIVYIGLILFSIICVIFWSLLRPLLLHYTSYNISTHIVIVVLIANLIFSLYKFEANYLFFSKNTKVLSVISLISAIVAIGLNFLLIPLIGILGAAYSTFISFIMRLILVYKIVWNEKNIVRD